MKRVIPGVALPIAGVMIGLLLSLQWVSTIPALSGETGTGTERVVLQVDGMTCSRCARPLEKALLQVSGVKKAEVSYREGRAVVECEKGKVADEQLVQAIEDQSSLFLTFKARVLRREVIR